MNLFRKNPRQDYGTKDIGGDLIFVIGTLIQDCFFHVRLKGHFSRIVPETSKFGCYGTDLL